MNANYLLIALTMVYVFWNVTISPVFAATTFQSTLIKTTDTAQFVPPAPDSAGITYMQNTGNLLMSDSEVDEMPIFQGVNLFGISRNSQLVSTGSTMVYSSEPTGLEYDPSNQRLFVTDDDTRKIHILKSGPDALFGTADDVVTVSLRTLDFGSVDPEGVSYDPSSGNIILADGVNAEVYVINHGSNGVFDGVAPVGDDIVTSFDTTILGVTDPEGIAVNTDTGSIYVVGVPQTVVIEVTNTGTLLTTIDISAAHAVKPAGLTYGPSSINPLQKSLYIVARGVDNNTNPTENDGKLYEMSIPQPPTPTPTLTPTIVVTLTPSITLTPTHTPSPTVTPTQSPTPTGVHCMPIGDIDCSREVNLIDLSILLSRFNTISVQADLDDSGYVNLFDLSILLTHFGEKLL